MAKSVLVVEDDFLLGMDLEATLSAAGWRVIGPAASVASALQLLESEPPDAAVLDTVLQDGLATPIAAALVSNRIPFVVVSARTNPHRLGVHLSSSRYLEKPLDYARLLHLLEQDCKSRM
jgi:two-component system, response regulator PdtaR